MRLSVAFSGFGPLAPTVVRAALDDVHDPCSEVAGVPAGIAEMALVHSLDIKATPAGAVGTRRDQGHGADVPDGPGTGRRGSWPAGSIPGVAAVEVTLSHNNDWMPSDMSAVYRTGLAAHQAAHRRDLALRETSLGAPMRIRRR